MFLALDFGGTKHSAASLIPGEAVWRTHQRSQSGAGTSAARDLDVMISLGKNALSGQTPLAVGVSFGGPVDFERGIVRLSHHVPGWENIPLADLIEAEFNAPALVDNDANAAGLGEAVYGAGQGLHSLCYITVSTGVGGGWIFNGEVWRGHEYMAGEIGHMTIDPQGPVCLCGKRGCVERLASGPYLALDMREKLLEQSEAGPLALEIAGGDLLRIDAATIAAAAKLGEPLAQAMITRAGRAIGIAIGNAANLVNPERFILGGGVTKSGPLFWDTLRNYARTTALPEIRVEIQPSRLGDDAPLWGAVRLAEIAADK